MKVIVHENQGRNFRLTIPTGLVLNRATALILPRILERKGVAVTREQTLRMIQAVRACRRSHPGWKLVEVESEDGSYVEIIL